MKTKGHCNSYLKALPNGKGGNRDPPKLENSNLKRKRKKLKNHKKQNKMLQRKKAFCQKTSIYKHWLYMTFRNAAKMEKLKDQNKVQTKLK